MLQLCSALCGPQAALHGPQVALRGCLLRPAHFGASGLPSVVVCSGLPSLGLWPALCGGVFEEDLGGVPFLRVFLPRISELDLGFLVLFSLSF